MRRVLAVVLPQLACEIARRKSKDPTRARAIGVLLEADEGAREAEVKPSAVLDFVSDEARRYGVRAGQKVSEASALHAHLQVHRVTHAEIDEALGRVAEIALAFGPLASMRLAASSPAEARTPWGAAPFDTVWLDLTGAAHLFGGEPAVLAEIQERVAGLGHRSQLAIARGPRLAQALARSRATSSTPIDALPIHALPLDPDTAAFLLRLGVHAVGDLLRLPRAKIAARLGPRAQEILALASGDDDTPLVPYAPPREIVEALTFEDGVETTEALLFVVRGMASRAAARLAARGEATTRIDLEIPLDRSIARLRSLGLAEHRFGIDLPAPLSSEADLLRTLRAKLEREALAAPAKGVVLRLSQIVASPETQLDLSRGRAVDPDSLPTLLAELSAEIGHASLGLLTVEDAHRPEATSRLVPVTLDPRASRRSGKRAAQFSLPLAKARRESPIPPPTRLLAHPIPLGRTRAGGVVAVASPKSRERQVFAIDDLKPLLELDEVEWWTSAPTSRSYMQAWVTSGGTDPSATAASGLALVFVEKTTGEMYLQGWYE